MKMTLIRNVYICRTSVVLIILTWSPYAYADGTAYNYWSTKAWGANFGNWLVLEKWMDSSIFDQYAPDAVDEWTFCKQAANPTQALTNHWNNWITEDDFRILSSVQANHVRIPVGYWAFIRTDPEEPYVTNGQKAQIERILGYCNKYNIYAIIDVHGLPGSQNGADHSGHSGPINFYSDNNIQRGLNTIQAVVNWMNGLNPTLKARFASIEVANEPRVSGNQLSVLKDFYTRAYDIINASKFKVPMMFHDAFQGLDAWSNFLLPPANALIDIHPYYAFPPSTDTNSIISGICNTRWSASHFHLPVFFGEWSLASGVDNSDSWLRQMMDTQVSVYKSSGAGGTFWALKNKINNKNWSFQQLINEGVINSETFSLHTNDQCSNRRGQIKGIGGRCVDVAGGGTGNGTPVQVYVCNGTPAQYWTLAADGSVQAFGKCLDVSGGGMSNGVSVQIYDCNGTTAQKWSLSSSGDIVSVKSNKCLDVRQPADQNGAPLQIWDCAGTSNQKWTYP